MKRTCPFLQNSVQPVWTRHGVILKPHFSGCADSDFDNEEELRFAVSVSSNTDIYSILDNISEADGRKTGSGEYKTVVNDAYRVVVSASDYETVGRFQRKQ